MKVYIGGAIEVELSRGNKAIVDEADLRLIEKHKWHTLDVKTNTFYAQSSSFGKKVLMHRLILGLVDPTKVVDHINGNGLDNRRSNLRVCTVTQNNRNNGLLSHNTLGVKGVFYRADGNRTKRWAARIYVNKKKINLGGFHTMEEAALAYNEAAKKHFGDYANLNKVAP